MSDPASNKTVLASEHHRNGRLADAEALYREVLEEHPSDASLWLALGSVCRDAGRQDDAIAAFHQALRLAPALLEAEVALAEAYAHLGESLTRQGRVAEAIEALAACARILESKPERARASYELGVGLLKRGNIDEAVGAFVCAVQLDPILADAHYGLSVALERRGDVDGALQAAATATRLDPGLADAHCSMGVALQRKGRSGEAIDAFRNAIRLKADHLDALSNLGAALSEAGDLDAGIATLRTAVLLPNSAVACNNLGNALRKVGERDEAIAWFERALRERPDYALAHSNLLYALHFHPGYDGPALLTRHADWNRTHAAHLARGDAHRAHDRTAERRLRIGYVSADLRRHPVGWSLIPLFVAHDHQRFEVFCYSDVATPDGVTEKLRSHADSWRNIAGESDDHVDGWIRRDAIDILVDLSMHTADNRLLVFARKPAPVQVTYLAYCSTTGLYTMDYRITDPHLDPDEGADAHYSEASVRLAETYWCYHPAAQSVDVGPVPMLASGVPTFGCLNDFGKVTPEALSLWARLLARVSNARFLLHAPLGKCRQRVLDAFAARGVHAERLTFVERLPVAEYMAKFGEIDIGLDPFPYGGGTTTCDALWMGVPVVTLRGQTAVGRGGASILSNVGLPELVARDADDYLRIAANLSSDAERLRSLRHELRAKMEGSALMDGPRFARQLETAYRQMWRCFCEG